MQIQYTVNAKVIEDNTSSFTGFGKCGDEEIVSRSSHCGILIWPTVIQR